MPDVSLPYRTDWQEMLNVVDYAKGSGADRASLDARFGASEMLRETLNALEELGLIVRDDADLLRLTDRGERLAYAITEDERRETLLESLLDYEPYRVPLLRARDEGRAVVDAPWLERVWQVDMRLGQPRNRVGEARTFFLRLGEIAGLGTFQRGVRGQPSRLELAQSFAEQIGDAEGRLAVSGRALPAGYRAEEGASGGQFNQLSGRRAGSSGGVHVVINVDITEWDIERIERFLDLIAERLPGAGIALRGGRDGDISQ